jgi:hypothetical protein
MPTYRVTWSSKWGQGEKIVGTAARAMAWIYEFRDKGADRILVEKDGQQISEVALPELMRVETAPS